MRKNTFGKYKFDSWVPKHTRDLIREFWGQMGRTHKDWLDSCKYDESDTCSHGPGPNGFKHPPYGATAVYLLRNYEASKQAGKDLYERVEGRYIHRWNNMATLIDKKGVAHCVSTCDMWVRVYTE